jgi:FADH2 O2-dependent halogenase
MATQRREIVLVGSGFAGSLLARLLALEGRDVLLVERGRHPRFALGESSTPLGNLVLERLARRYGQSDLHQLAAYGRWLRHDPHLRRGLKRGFTFYRHRSGEPFRNTAGNDARLLVAASPEDAVADTHWLRSDVDAHFAAAAVAAGAELLEETELDRVELGAERVHLAGERRGRRLEIACDLVIDATGPGGFLARHLPIPEHPRPAVPATGLVYGHFEGVRSFAEAAAEDGAEMPPGPYPDDRAAVHHLLAEGWMYVLPFDPVGGRTLASAGFVLRDGGAVLGAPPEETFRALLARYPTLERQFAAAQPVRPVAAVPHLPRRLARAAGRRWLLLPHALAFYDPMFSTGIAWSLLGVERLAEALGGPGPVPPQVERYGELVEQEAERIGRLIEAAWRAMAIGDFRIFAATSHLYFAAVSWAETRQRLEPEARPWAWDAFLGGGDPVLGPLLPEALARLEPLAARAGALTEDDRRGFETWVAESIAPRNLAGLADPARANLYPADPELLVERAHLLGWAPEQMRQALPRLRGV